MALDLSPPLPSSAPSLSPSLYATATAESSGRKIKEGIFLTGYSLSLLIHVGLKMPKDSNTPFPSIKRG